MEKNQMFNYELKNSIGNAAVGIMLNQGLAKEYNLLDKINILGMLDAGKMKEQYINSSVYVCPSILENSPNSMGEAMCLGIPVVASRSGGVPSMVEDEKEALLKY